ncbi:hypothetical protein DFH11DRAFT_1703905 [Phellopilus nigrolimitatus]|nr:hypothetical protein DFH11DRAFT_1703905 [Phellopilus nigrolimitatus]
MRQTKIIFYDIKTRLVGLPTSHNTWRARLVLNYKHLNYETIWSEGFEIDQTCIAAGIPPLEQNADGSPRYTLPALVDLTQPDAPVRLTDSLAIIDYLEATYPDPDPQRALFPKGTRAYQALAVHYVEESLFPLFASLVLLGMWEKQTDRSRVKFRNKYEAMAGKPLEEILPHGEERAETWRKFRAFLDTIDSFADKSGERGNGPFFSGANPSFIDFHLLAGLLSMKVSLEEEFQKEMENCSNGRWVNLIDACADLIK